MVHTGEVAAKRPLRPHSEFRYRKSSSHNSGCQQSIRKETCLWVLLANSRPTLIPKACQVFLYLGAHFDPGYRAQ